MTTVNGLATWLATVKITNTAMSNLPTTPVMCALRKPHQLSRVLQKYLKQICHAPDNVTVFPETHNVPGKCLMTSEIHHVKIWLAMTLKAEMTILFILFLLFFAFTAKCNRTTWCWSCNLETHNVWWHCNKISSIFTFPNLIYFFTVYHWVISNIVPTLHDNRQYFAQMCKYKNIFQALDHRSHTRYQWH